MPRPTVTLYAPDEGPRNIYVEDDALRIFRVPATQVTLHFNEYITTVANMSSVAVKVSYSSEDPLILFPKESVEDLEIGSGIAITIRPCVELPIHYFAAT